MLSGMHTTAFGRLRAARNVTRDQLATASGVSISTLRRVE
jgi:transcriptional regulator with XRE-family HTH domain